ALSSSHHYGDPVFSSVATPPTGLYTLSLHDALPISVRDQALDRGAPHVSRSRATSCDRAPCRPLGPPSHKVARERQGARSHEVRSEEHTSELQSPYDLVCRLLLEKKKKNKKKQTKKK